MPSRIQPRNLIEEDDPRVSKFGHPAPPWLVNYADLMTELVCFFIILYALSAVLSKHIQNAKKELDKIIKEENLKAKTTITKEGVRFSLEEQGDYAYFASGKADLTDKMVHLLTKLGPLFKSLPNEIVIEGHTDARPISSDEYASNWELSSARALTVLHHLVDDYHLEQERVSAIGYGEFRPAAPNDTPENMAKNRRVVFFIKNVPPKKNIDAEQDNSPEKKHAPPKAEKHAAAKPMEPAFEKSLSPAPPQANTQALVTTNAPH